MPKRARSLSRLALQKFFNNFWGAFSFLIILVYAFVALFAFILAPDHSENSNQMHLSIHSKPPGFSIKMFTLPVVGQKETSFFGRFLHGNKNANEEIPIVDYKTGLDFIEVAAYRGEGVEGIVKRYPLSEFPESLTSDEVAQNYIKSRRFILGTDKYGRDLLSRIIVGTRISFSIGFMAVFISLVVGVFLGSLGGYFGGRIDGIILWLINVSWSIPTLLLVIAITLALGKGFWQVFLAVGLSMWVEVARVVRGQIKSVKEMQFVTAARALGFSHSRIIFNHILPNITAPIIVISAANFAAAILIESGLSFLGIGAQPPTPSWGNIIRDHYSYIVLGKPWLAIVPGLTIMGLVMAFMLMGSALRDALDVKD